MLFQLCPLLQVYVRYSDTCARPTYYFVEGSDAPTSLPPTVKVVEPATKPLISAARTIAPVWVRTFTKSGFQLSVDVAPPKKYTMRHMAEPSVK